MIDGNNVENYNGGALYLTSLSQMVLHSGAFLNFVNNAGRYAVKAFWGEIFA